MLFFYIAAMIFFSCNSSEERSLSGVEWVVMKMNGKNIDLGEEGDISIIFDAASHRVTGNAGCNNFFGTYTESSEGLEFSKIGVTKMSCPNIHVEMTFLKILEDADGYTIKGNRLSLKENGNIIAVFRAGERIKK